MSTKKKRVLLTGASGSMGGEAFKELLRRRDKCDIVLLLRPSKQNREAFGKYDGQSGVTIVWGDLCNPDDVLKAVNGVDHVLHPAALIAPEADDKPKQCRHDQLRWHIQHYRRHQETAEKRRQRALG